MLQKLRRFFARTRQIQLRRNEPVVATLVSPAIEPLESRTLLSAGLSATAQLNLVSTSNSPSPIYNYDITLNNTGTTDIATFWFSWVPSEDFLPSIPTLADSPAGWSRSLTGAHSSTDGTAIEWLANAGAAIPAGQTLSGFTFSTADSPSRLAGLSPTHTTELILTSMVFTGAPLADPGYEFIVADTAANPAPTVSSTTTLMASSTSLNLGDPVTFTATVAATGGSGPAPTGSVTFKDGTTNLGVAGVQSNGTALFTTTSLAAGSHNITASYGGDTTYVASNSTPPVTVAVSSLPGGGGPSDLVPQLISSTLPAAVVSGVPVHGAISMDVANNSSTPFSGPVIIDLYASASGSLDNSAVLVTEITKNLLIAGGQSEKVKLPVKALPDGLAAGFYTLIAQTIDPSSNVNTSSTGITVQVAAPFVALSETFRSLTLPPAVVGGAKTKAVATLSISNSGNVTTSGSTTIDLFATTDGQIDQNATLIKSFVKSLHIKSGKAATVKVPLGMMPTVADGDYTIVARVTDQAQNVSGVAFGTPVNIAAPFVALSAALGTVTPRTIFSGKSGSVTLTLVNSGNVIASDTTTVDLTLSTDGTQSLDSVGHQSSRLTIKPGASKTLHLHFKIPSGHAGGSFFLTALIVQGVHSASAVSGGFVISG